MKIKKTILSVLACMLSLVFVFAFTACGETDDSTVQSVTLDVATVTLGPGDTQRLTATVTLKDGTKGEVDEWTTSAENVATVTRGVVAAKAAGTATITAKAGNKTATCAVTVEDITVSLDKTTLALERGTEGQLAATVKKNGTAATGETVDWASSDELIATVDATGKVTAVSEGVATITATRHGANQKASCEVTVSWTKPAGYAKIDYYEQNKVPTNTWGYWNDPAEYVGGKSEMIEAYYQTSAQSQAGKVNFTFKVNERQANKEENQLASIIQINYRSSDEQENGVLHTNHNYKISLQLTSNVAGKIGLNTIGNPDNFFEIQKGDNTLEATFRHGDWGVIFPDGVYDNVESAAFVLLGLLGTPGEKVEVSIDKLTWTDLGETETKTEKPDFSPPKAPDLSTVEALAWTLASDDAEKYTITSTDNKSYTVAYKTTTSTYESIAVDLSGFETDKNNTFALTIKNNGDAEIALRFDLKGTIETEIPGGEPHMLECVTAAVAEGGSANFNKDWGGTEVKVAAGQTATVYLTYECETHGKPVTLSIFFNTQYYNDVQEARTGNVTLSGFKFANVTEE